MLTLHPFSLNQMQFTQELNAALEGTLAPNTETIKQVRFLIHRVSRISGISKTCFK